MAKDYDELSENEKELMETMKSPPEEGEEVTVVSEDSEPAEQEAEQKGQKRDPDGKFAKAEQEGESEPELEQEQESGAEEQPDKRFVPLDALHAERGRRKDAEGELQELRQTVQQLQETYKQFQSQQQLQPQDQSQQQAQPEEPPDPVVDKAAFDAWLQKKIEAVQQPYQQFQTQAEQYQRQQQEMQRLQQYASEHEQAFRKEYGDDDYNGALNFMRERTRRNFKLFGVPDHELDQALAQEEVKLTAMAAQRNINPAALIYNMAVENGYQPASKQQSGSEAERVQKLGEAQKQTKSAAGTSGSAREEEYTVERLASMSEAELAKLPPETIRRAMGG